MSATGIETTAFLFAVTRLGAEPFLKEELARTRPDLKLAFSRPGFLTFKAPEVVDGAFALEAIFAREHGASLGPMKHPDDVARIGAALAAGGARPRLFVFDRAPAEDELETPLATEIEAEARSSGVFSSEPPRHGDPIVDLIVHAGEPPWLGFHVHGPHRAPRPGGRWGITLPPDAPSRAYLKIEEAIAWSGARPRRGEVALELGSAPGGASLALLRRGIDVVGVDPGAMAPVVLAHDGSTGARFSHRMIPAGALKKQDLPRPLHWIAMDMNLAPRVALRYAERVIGPARRTLFGAFLTLKLNSLGEAREIPALLERIRSFGFVDVRGAQLPSHRQEIGVVALTERGVARRDRG